MCIIFIICVLYICHTRFGASGSEVGSRHQEQNREGGIKAQNRQYMAGWAGCYKLSFLGLIF
jgi:ABC-type uncharacterized transport system permease subunit